MKTVNFENDFYQNVYEYLTLLHGSKNIKHIEEYRCIEVELSNIRYFLLYSGCEDKIYFTTVSPFITVDLSYEKMKLFKDFRVFRYAEAKKYIDFKKLENELITEIQG